MVAVGGRVEWGPAMFDDWSGCMRDIRVCGRSDRYQFCCANVVRDVHVRCGSSSVFVSALSSVFAYETLLLSIISGIVTLVMAVGAWLG